MNNVDHFKFSTKHEQNYSNSGGGGSIKLENLSHIRDDFLGEYSQNRPNFFFSRLCRNELSLLKRQQELCRKYRRSESNTVWCANAVQWQIADELK